MGREVADEEADRQIGGYGRAQTADQDLAPDVFAVVAGKIRKLVDTGREDDRRREEKREAGGVLVIQTANEPCDHRDAGATDPGEQRERLRDSDDAGFLEVERRELATFFDIGATGGGVRTGKLAHLGASADALTTKEDQAVDREEYGGCERLGEDGAERVLEEKPGDAGRDGRDDEQPRQPLVG